MFNHIPRRLASTAILAVLIFNMPIALRAQAATASGRQPAAAARQRADEALLTMRVQSSLAGRLDTDALRIRVSSQGRTILLTGEVEKPSSIALAESVARSVEGVEDVINRLTLLGDR
jgi:osmotically-inducible protein OsmY